MRVTVLASGSSGNATLFESGASSVLVDAGVAPRALEESLVSLGARVPDAIVITHAHLDHVGHAARIARRRNVPVYLTEATSRAVQLPAQVEEYRFQTREPFEIGALLLEPLPVPHDAANVSLRISDAASSAGLATDLGEPTGALLDHLRGCDVVLLESNHDERLLACGPYPFYLKRRVASSRGHLSNRQAHALLRRLGPRAHTVVLVHLSSTNNTPELALEEARDALSVRVAVHVAPARGTLSVQTTLERLERGGEREAASDTRRRRPIQLSLL
ncbi:MAG: MBL fold metallo-hydrolase [Deltaproteobacteria bacterium]|nr:MBL fold metallo-hydrolase [Deltaproteobacteria bacterium]